MSKDFAWELFKNTGNVDAFMIMRNIENGLETQTENEPKDILGGSDISGDNKN